MIVCVEKTVTGRSATHAMEERCASASGSDNENSEVSMRTLLQTMQAQMVSLVQKVSDIEKNVESENRKSNAVGDSRNETAGSEHESLVDGVGVCERDSMPSFAGGESDDYRPTPETCRSTKGECSSAGGESSETASDAGFCVEEQTEEESDVFSLLESELEVGEQLGKPISEKLANIANSRFSTKIPYQKLEERMAKHPIPENCCKIKPPGLNIEVIEKGNLDKFARKNDARIENIQKLVSRASAAILGASDKLHARIGEASAEVPRREFVSAANEMLTACGEAIALLGTAQQELSYRRRYQLLSALPKDMASICGNETIPITDKLFGGDVEKDIRTAREKYKAKHNQASPRFHPYRRTPSGGSFLGQAAPSYSSQRGNSHGQRGRGKNWNQDRGFKFSGRGKRQ